MIVRIDHARCSGVFDVWMKIQRYVAKQRRCEACGPTQCR